ncbi:MAG: FkbM family methyltransferase [Acidobacteriota bacterium]
MKARDFGYLLGFRPAARTYGCELVTFTLAVDGLVRYAQWLHPAESRKTISQDAVDELRTFIRPGDVAIDIGAHTGDSTIPIALAAGPTGRVLALEPNPHVYAVLVENAALNPDSTAILPLNFAATPAPGEFEFQYSDAGYCNGGIHQGTSRWRHGHAFPLKVRGEHLSRYLQAHHADLVPRLRYIKVDAEGFDAAILETLDDVITQTHPYLRAEVHKLTGRAQREAMFDFLVDHGYEVFRFESDVHYRGEPVGRGDLLRWRHYDVFCVPSGQESTATRGHRLRQLTPET